MKALLLVSGLLFALVPPVAAQNRDSDGDVLSTYEYAYAYRDSDGDVISVLPKKVYYRDSDGEVISVIYLESLQYAADDGRATARFDFGPEMQIPTTTNANGDVVLPDQISVDGLIYKVIAAEDEIYLEASSRVNPTAFGLD